MQKRLVGLGVAAITALALSPGYASPVARRSPTPTRLGLHFEPNRGQFPATVDFAARGQGFALKLSAANAAIATRRSAVGVNLIGASARPKGSGVRRTSGLAHYMLGRDQTQWVTGVPMFQGAQYRGVYPGIDLVYYVHRDSLEHDFIVAPGADPGRIRFGITGARAVRLAPSGDLIIKMTGGDLALRRPVAYQDAEGRRKSVAARFVLAQGATPVVSFALGRYDRSRPLIIDPVLAYSTFVGGENEDYATDVAVDAAGHAYVCGATQSVGFPTTAGAFSTALTGQHDAFVTKLTPDGTGVVYSTYVGGQVTDQAQSIRVDANGSAYVTGFTDSVNFPVTVGAYQTAYAGSRDTFTFKLHPSGGGLIYSTFVGGSLLDQGMDIQIGSDLSAYVTGFTQGGTFPVGQEAFDPTPNGAEDVFVYRLSPSGAALGYATYVGGPGNDRGHGIDVDSNGFAYVTGYASNGFPVTAGAFDTTYGGGFDAFVFRLNPTGTALGYSTYIGGGLTDQGNDLALAPDNRPVITGLTQSANFPTTPGCYDSSHNGVYDAFVTVLNAGGASLHASTFLGGAAGSDIGNAVSLSLDNEIAVTGSTEGGLPTTAGAYDTTHNGDLDVFVARFDFGCSALLYSTYVGSGKSDAGQGIDTFGATTLYVAGETSGSAFPTTPGAFDTTFAGSAEAFALRLQLQSPTTLTADNASGQIGSTVFLTAALTDGVSPLAGMLVDFSVDATSIGSAPTDGTGKAQVSYSISTGPTGSRAILAEFAGDATYSGSSGAASLQVVPANTSIFVPQRTGTITELVILRAFLRRVPDSATLAGQTIQFSVDGSVVGSSVTGANGRADLDWVVTDGPASRPIVAEFAGDADYNASSGSATLTAETHATKMFGTDRSGRITAYVVFRAWLYRLDSTPVRNKTIAFSLDGTPLGSAPTSTTGRAQIGYTIADGAGAGTRTINADWAGDGGYLATSATNTLTVNKATPYIWVLPRSVPLGGTARLYAYFRRLSDYQPQAGKPVDFKVDGTLVQSLATDAFGIARYSYVTIEPVGVHTTTCEFAGDAWLDPGSGSANLTIF